MFAGYRLSDCNMNAIMAMDSGDWTASCIESCGTALDGGKLYVLCVFVV